MPNGLLYLRERMRTEKSALWWGIFCAPRLWVAFFAARPAPGAMESGGVLLL